MTGDQVALFPDLDARTPTLYARSRLGTTRNRGRYYGNGREWATPPEVFRPLHAEFAFTIDVCASPANAKLPRFYSETTNGLRQSWAGERVFMNPPYGKAISAWTRKARDESARALIVGLLPASVDLAWFHDDVVAAGAEVRYLRGRVRWLVGTAHASSFSPVLVVVWRPA